MRVVELNLASKLMAHRANEDVVDLVTLIVVADLPSVLEGHNLVAICQQRCRVDPGFCLEAAPASHGVQTCRTLEQDVSNRRSVLRLLQINL